MKVRVFRTRSGTFGHIYVSSRRVWVSLNPNTTVEQKAQIFPEEWGLVETEPVKLSGGEIEDLCFLRDKVKELAQLQARIDEAKRRLYPTISSILK